MKIWAEFVGIDGVLARRELIVIGAMWSKRFQIYQSQQKVDLHTNRLTRSN